MKFKIGQRVELVDNSGMCASIGAIAVIHDMESSFINVLWKTRSNGQSNGGYFLWHFKPAIKKNEQLLFDFME